MTREEIEKMFLELNSVLVKFWKEQGRPDKEIKIELLERMLHWYREMGYCTLDKQELETIPTFDSIWGWYSYIIEQSKKEPGYSERNSKLLADSFLELASRQEPLNLPPFILDKIDDALKSLQESIQRKIQEPSLPSNVDEAAETFAESIWKEMRYELVYDNLTESFKAGAEWQKEQDNYDAIFHKGMMYYRKRMLEEAVEGKIYGYDDGSYELVASWLDLPKGGIYKNGDKVRIVVLKEEGEK